MPKAVGSPLSYSLRVYYQLLLFHLCLPLTSYHYISFLYSRLASISPSNTGQHILSQLHIVGQQPPSDQLNRLKKEARPLNR